MASAPRPGGGLVAMGRAWFNLTGGFDEGMHGWGGENLAARRRKDDRQLEFGG